jgi:predicted outer membrane protein
MSVMERMSIGVLMASFCCVLTGIAAAQQAAPATDRDQSEARDNVSDQGNPGARNRASQQQRERSTFERVGGRELSNRPNSRSQALIGGQNQDVEQFLVGCLLAKNGSEVELSQFAEKQAQSAEVKKFAQMMIQDHQKMIQELEQLAGTQGNTSKQADRSNDALSTDADNQRVGNHTSGNSSRDLGTPGVGDSTISERSGEVVGDRTAVDSRTTRTNPASPGSNAAIQELAQIDRQIVERQTQATLEDLQQKSGAEFDKCLVGGAIVAHVHMIAALQVLEQQGQGQLAQAAKQARPVAEQHLEHAKQLMKQLESGATKVGQAERRPAGTQR